MPDLDAVAAALGLTDQRAALAAGWSEHGAQLGEGTPAFLGADAIAAAARRAGLAAEASVVLVEGLAALRTLPALGTLAAHARSLVLARRSAPDGGGWSWPLPSVQLHPAAPLVYAWAVLGCVDDLFARNRARGIADAVTAAGLRDLGRWMEEYRRAKGHWGFDRMSWLWCQLAGSLHELGRLQYNLAHWEARVRVLRHRREGRLALLMEGRLDLRGDGQWQEVARTPRDPAGFTTAYSEGPEGWCGHAVDADGNAARQPSSFAAADWEQVLGRGDPVLFLHIPAGGGLDPEACRDSLRQARDFFPRHYPRHAFKAVISISWMFDSQLARHLPAESNLVRFQRLFHLHPHPDLSGEQIRERVLGDAKADPARLVPGTSLQRAVVGHLLAGGYWKQQGAVILPDEIA